MFEAQLGNAHPTTACPPKPAAELTVAMREHLAAASAAAMGKREASSGGVSGMLSPRASPSPAQLAIAQRRAEEAAGVAAATAHWRAAAQLAVAQKRSEKAAEAAGATAAAAARRRLSERAAEQQQALLLRWVEEQEGAAYEALEAAKASLLALKVRWLVWQGRGVRRCI